MNLHFCHVCKEIRDTADGFCVMCHSFLGGTPPESPAVTCAGCGRPVTLMVLGNTLFAPKCLWCGGYVDVTEDHA